MPKLVCMTQVYNENSVVGWDGKTNIERFMESVTKYCDGLVIFDDGSNDGTREVITDMADGIELEIPSNKINTPLAEGYHRARSLEHCRRLNADWVLCLDPDEVMEKSAEYGALDTMLTDLDEICQAVTLDRFDLWRTDRFVRTDGNWSASAGIRLFRPSENVSYDIGEGCRLPIEPLFKDTIIGSVGFLKIVHYGYSSDELIEYKYRRFRTLDIDLESHLDDENIKFKEVSSRLLKTKPLGPSVDVYRRSIKEKLLVP